MEKVTQTVREIKELKIQGATSIARASLSALLKDKGDLAENIKKLSNARPNEPMARNCLSFVLWQTTQDKPLQEVVTLMLSRLEDVENEIVKNGVNLIKPGANILIHCHSSAVEEVLRTAHRAGTNFQVFLTETRPKMQGRITAKKLIKEGIKVTMMIDSAAGFTLSKLDKIDIDLVLLGADAITVGGSVINKIGSYSIALSAKQAKIPLFILASLLKFEPAAKSASEIKLEERASKEIWPESPPKNLQFLNLAFDVLPANLITELVTEFGCLKPGKAKKIAKKNYPWLFRRPKTEGRKKKFSYFHLHQKIDLQEHLVASYKILPLKRETIEQVAAESSIGTWTEITKETERRFDQLSAKIIAWQKKTGLIKIAYPLELFEKSNLAQLLSSVAGNIFGMKAVRSLHLLDLDFPKKYVISFKGPQIGLKGIYQIAGVRRGPLLGSIIKPKLGLKPRDYADLALSIFQAGFHLVKDDENLTSQCFNLFEKRVEKISYALKKNGFLKNKLYAFNVSAETEIMKRRARFVKEKGGRCVMVDVLTTGFSGLQNLTKQKLNLVIHGHRAMHGVMTRGSDFSLSMLVIAKLARLAGIDSLHTGTVVGKMEGEEKEIIRINNFLRSDWYGLKKVLPVASGGLHPGLIPQLMKILGKDLLINFGGGVHGHPQGVAAGAQAVVEAVEAISKGRKLKEYAQEHQDLKIALEKWGEQ